MARPETALPIIKRGQIWAIDFEPQTHTEESGKRHRPALVVQSDLLNDAGHPTTIVIPGTTKTYRDSQGDGFPLRVALGRQGSMSAETDLLIDQVRTISNRRILGAEPLAVLPANHMRRVLDALRLLTG